MKKQLIRISILQSSKIVVALYFVMGFLYTLIGLPMAIFGTHRAIKIMGIVYIFGPIWMAVIGFIFFVIFSGIYNLLSGWLGGFEFEVKDVGEGSLSV